MSIRSRGRRSAAITAQLSILVPGLVLGAFLGSVSGTPAHAAPARQDGATTVSISPAATELACGETANVDIRIDDVKDLAGVDVKVSFDPNVVEVVDADGDFPGTQVAPGDLPDVGGGQGVIQLNSVDGASGTISYAAARLLPAEPQSGSGVIASVTFRGKAAGTSPVDFSSVLLSDASARSIQAEKQNGAITVTCDGQPQPTAQPEPTKDPGTGGDDDDDDGDPCNYVVKKGDTLFSIARSFGSTVSAISAANKLKSKDLIFPGQKLVIPDCKGGDPVDPKKPGDCITYVVKAGDTLTGIALANGDTVSAIALRNKVVNTNLIYVGQRLTVCPKGGAPDPGEKPSGCKSTHVVKAGENLFRLAILYKTTVSRLVAANNLASANLIYAGQTLCIP